jgi:hypothetical protein
MVAALPKSLQEILKEQRQRAERSSILSERDVDRMPVGLGAGLPHDCGCATYMVGMAVRQDQMF